MIGALSAFCATSSCPADHLQFRQRQFDTGFFVPDEREVGQVSNNTITIGDVTGSGIGIVQGSPGTNQSLNATIKIDDAKAAVAAVEACLGELRVPADALSNLTSDLTTIKAQLAKVPPSHLIICEAARSFRNVVEGAIGGMLTPSFNEAIVALGKATGAY